jgi:hypothetical protein
MRKQGTVTRWDEAKGFGFIHSPASTADKPSFLVSSWLTAVLHCAALAAFVWWIR